MYLKIYHEGERVVLKAAWFEKLSWMVTQFAPKSKYNKKAISYLNTEVKKREEQTEEKWTINLQPISTQEPRSFVRETSGVLH